MKRRHILPDNMAVWHKGSAKKVPSNVALALADIWPHYEADLIC